MAGLSRFDGWVPIRVFPEGRSLAVDWCHFGPRRFDQPFFRDAVDGALQLPFNRAFRQQTPIDDLVAVAHERPGIAPTAFVFHASRCGSTLAARMLMALDTHVVISEPTMLDFVLRSHPLLPDADDETRRMWLRALVSALAQPRAGGETRFVVKFDAWNIMDFPMIQAAFPATPWIFVYRDPVDIAASQWRQPGAHMVPGMLGPTAAVIPIEEAVRMPREEYVARVVGRILAAGAAHCAAAGGHPVHYDELPDAIESRLATMLGVDSDAATRARMRDVTQWDAKTPQLPYDPDAARKQREVTPALRAAVDLHAMASYRALEALRSQCASGIDADATAMPAIATP